MKRGILFATVLVLLFTACKKEDENKYYGITVFSSELILVGEYYTGYGFSFEQEKRITCTDINCSAADVVAVHLILQEDIEEVFLQSPENEDAFYLNGSFDTETEAIDFYDSYTEVGELEFVSDADDLQAHQVWTLQTRGKKFAKIRIMKVNLITEGSYPYAEVEVEYHYQPDGSRTFPPCGCN